MDLVKEYWNKNVSNWKVAADLDVGSVAFFKEVERYRFDKLDYLEAAVGFDGFAGQAVLDVGCGLGSDTARFAKSGADVTAIDIAPRAIDLAQENFAWRSLDARFDTMDGEAMAFEDDSFDFVYCHTVLHFAENPQKIVEEVHRVLKPGGRAILMTINRKSWLYALHKIAGAKLDYMDAPVFHKFSPGEFDAMLGVFETRRLKLFRFPVRTEVHKGWKARVYNGLFVDVFNALPKRLTAKTGYHMLAFVTKAPVAP